MLCTYASIIYIVSARTSSKLAAHKIKSSSSFSPAIDEDKLSSLSRFLLDPLPPVKRNLNRTFDKREDFAGGLRDCEG